MEATKMVFLKIVTKLYIYEGLHNLAKNPWRGRGQTKIHNSMQKNSEADTANLILLTLQESFQEKQQSYSNKR